MRSAADRGALGRLADDGVLTALVDACDAPAVPARVLARFPDGGACLYQGADALAFRDRAPYLVRVDAEVLAWLLAPAAASGGPEGGLGDTPWGLFVVSDAPFAEQVRHWRGWLTVAPPAAPDGTHGEQEPMAFRFYDPRLVEVFLGACTAGEVAQFFGPCRSLVVPAWEAGAPRAAPNGAPGAGWIVTPGLAARQAGRVRRGVGERFRMRDAHLAAFRRRSFGDALVATFERDAAVAGPRAWRDPADPVAGDVLAGTPGSGQYVRFGFDPRGALGSVTTPLGRTSRFESDERGQPVQLATPSGLRLTFERDAAGEIARVTRTLPYTAAGTPPGTSPLPYSARYSAREGTREVFRADHDAVGRLVAAAYPDGTRASITYRDQGTRAGVDVVGAHPAEVTDRLGRTTRFAYAADGTLTALTDALGRDTTFRYGAWNRPSEVAYPGRRTEGYAYDTAGRLAGVRASDGVMLRVTTDDAGRPTALLSAGQRGVTTEMPVAPVDVRLEYDGGGRAVASRALAAGGVPVATTHAYDDAGRLVRETLQFGHGAEPVAVGAVYDAAGALAAVVYPTGERVTFAADADGRLIEVVDWAGRAYHMDYAPADGGWRLATPDGVVLSVAQDAAGLAVAAQVSAPGDAARARTAWAYDAEDRVAAADDARLGAWRYAYDAEGQLVASDGPTAAESGRYGYDAAGNRVRVREGAGPEQEVVVGVGDRLFVQGTRRFTYDAAGRVAAACDGARASGHPDAVAWRYAYDARGQLVAATQAGPTSARRVVTYAYDAFGRRVEKCALELPAPNGYGAGPDAPREAGRVRATRTRFVWAGEQCVREVVERAEWAPADGGAGGAEAGVPADAAWRPAEARDTLHWPGTGTPLLVRVMTFSDGDGAAPGGPSTATYLCQTDPLGTPVRLWDAAGGVAWEAAYAPFGAARETVCDVAQAWRRPGQYADAETGLYYNRFRYYDPATGRYLTPDPVGLLGGLHPYRYAENGPTHEADPLGLWPSWGTIGRVAATVAVGVVAAVAVAALVTVAAPAIVAAGVAVGLSAAAAGTVASGAALIAAGAAAGAASMAMNTAFDTHFTCVACLVKPALKGAAVGALAAAPFLAVPASLTGAAAVAAYAGAGGASGAIGYVGNWFANGAHPDQWSWTGLGLSVAGGMVLGPFGRNVGGSGGSPGMRLAVPRLVPEFAMAGGPALAPSESVVVVGAVSAQGARAVGTGVQASAGATGMAMSATGGGGGGNGSRSDSESEGGEGTESSGQRGVTDEEYEALRSRTPSAAQRREVNRGVTLPMDDPALPGQQITKPLQADHIVSMDRITRMDGFGQLSRENQLRILNDPENFVGLSEAANKSKGARSFADWIEHKGLGVQVDPEFRRQMIQREQEVVPKLQGRIQELLREQQAGGGQ